MKKILFAFICLGLPLFSHEVDYCFDEDCTGCFAIEGTLATGGNASIGLNYYAPWWEIGIFGGGKIVNNEEKTRIFTPGIFGGFRYYLCEGTYFAFGVDLLGKFGTQDDEKVKRYYGVGPYLSLEKMLSCHVMVSLWYNPYFYSYEKREDWTTRTSSFSSGGVGLKYLF